MVVMRMACDGMCLTGREYDYDCLIIAGMDCTYLLVRRKILRLYRLTPLWWCYESMGYGWVVARYGVRVFILPLSLRQIPECMFMQFRSKKF